MIIFLCILFAVLTIVFYVLYDGYNTLFGVLFALCVIITSATITFGVLHGFIYYPKTEGSHVGVITAVDLEGKYFRRYEVYLKSSGYTEQSDETKYLIYETEENLANKLKECIGKKVKLYYGHDGGYINWKSCGTYHIKNVELVEE